MVTMNQVKTGILQYIVSDGSKILSDGQKFAAKLVVCMLLNNFNKNTFAFRENMIAQFAFAYIDDENNVDIEQLYQAAKEAMSKDGQSVDIPKVGKIKFTHADIDSLYKYISQS